MNKIDVYERQIQDIEDDMFLRYFSDCWDHHSCSECSKSQLCLDFTSSINKFRSVFRLLELSIYGDADD